MNAAVIVLILSATTAHASITDPCTNLKGEEKIMCEGIAKLDMKKCEKLSIEKKAECTRKIVDIQRKNK